MAVDMSGGPTRLLLAPTVTSVRSLSGDLRKHILPEGVQLALGTRTVCAEKKQRRGLSLCAPIKL